MWGCISCADDVYLRFDSDKSVERIGITIRRNRDKGREGRRGENSEADEYGVKCLKGRWRGLRLSEHEVNHFIF